MFIRCVFFVLLVILSSCDKFTFKNNNNLQNLDTFVDFSSVDTYPSFKICDTIIDKNEQTNCFSHTLHKKIAAELLLHPFIVKDSIAEVVYVAILINSRGIISLENIESSKEIKKQLPSLDSVLQISIAQLPAISPAIKRGIPVTTKYRLPIKIQLKN